MKNTTMWLNLGLIALALTAGCGTSSKKGKDSATTGGSADGTAPDYVKVCKKPAAAATPAATTPTALSDYSEEDALALTATDPNWKDDISPMFQGKCAGNNCHNPDTAGRLNVRNFTNVVNAVVNIKKRIENARDLGARFAADPTIAADDNAFNTLINGYTNGERPMPQNITRANIATTMLSDAQYNMFALWITNGMKQYGAGEVGDDAPDLKTSKDFTDTEEDKSSFETALSSADCKDGMEINTDANWAKVAKLLDPGEPNAADVGYYDYTTKQWVKGKKASFECTFENFEGSIGIDEVTNTLNQYKAYGWRISQCAVVNGLPHAGLIHINKASGEKLGINIKWFDMEVAQAPK